MVLLQARCPRLPGVLTVLEDAHVFLLGKDGVVGLQAVLLEELLITAPMSEKSHKGPQPRISRAIRGALQL